MKSIFILLLLIFNVSCSSYVLRKQATKKYIKTRYVDVSNHMKYKNIAFHYDGINCFENQDEREVVTTDSHYFEYAINHFYERMLKVNIVGVRSNNKYAIAKAHYYEKFSFDLETATCYFVSPYFPNSHGKLLISFRKTR